MFTKKKVKIRFAVLLFGFMIFVVFISTQYSPTGMDVFLPTIVLLGCLFPITLLVGLGWWFGRLRKDKPMFSLEKDYGKKKHSEKTSRSDGINN